MDGHTLHLHPQIAFEVLHHLAGTGGRVWFYQDTTYCRKPKTPKALDTPGQSNTSARPPAAAHISTVSAVMRNKRSIFSPFLPTFFWACRISLSTGDTKTDPPS